VGTGGPRRPVAAFGVDPGRYVARFTEGLALMKALWTESSVTFDGEFWQLKDAAMEPKPAQKPHPPIWFGGSGPTALRRAVRLGDGFFGAGSTPTEKFAGQVQVVREALAGAGRPAREFRIANRRGLRGLARPRPDQPRAGAAVRAPVAGHRGRRGRRLAGRVRR
jgi:alkanesulfonate monooxygenase SsuD/methylene tetrahydromethanopterin reductase-like flavin-dependent oxidoreductase (luciferase family)